MRVKLAQLAPGDRYYLVTSATGVCLARYTTRAEARAMVALDPARRNYKERIK